MKRMATLLGILIASSLLLASQAFAEKMYITTIKNASIKQVQDTIIDVTSAKNFTVDAVEPYKVVVTKDFGDGFWAATHHCMVKFNMLERDGFIKLTVTETELVQGFVHRARSIDQLIPMIKEIRSKIDGTPNEAITNEAVKEEPNTPQEKPVGLILGEKNTEGLIPVLKVEADSKAAEVKLTSGDLIAEIDGKPSASFDQKTLSAYIENKIAAKGSVILVYVRNDKKDLLVLK